MGVDEGSVARAGLRASFEEMNFQFSDPTALASGVPQQMGKRDTTLIAMVGPAAALTKVSVIGFASADDPGVNATIMLGMAVALQQVAPWASDWWAETGPELAKQATAVEDQTATAETGQLHPERMRPPSTA